jgi:hypothetical protein
MRRREFIAWLGSAAVWPMAARAQQTAMLRKCEEADRLCCVMGSDGLVDCFR